MAWRPGSHSALSAPHLVASQGAPSKRCIAQLLMLPNQRRGIAHCHVSSGAQLLVEAQGAGVHRCLCGRERTAHTVLQPSGSCTGQGHGGDTSSSCSGGKWLTVGQAGKPVVDLAWQASSCARHPSHTRLPTWASRLALKDAELTAMPAARTNRQVCLTR